jgi:thymidylate kinase
MRRGFVVGFLGIDGLGKSTLASALAEQLECAGVDVVQVSWRRSLEETARPWPRVALQQLWLETYRLLLAGSTTVDGPVEIPRSYEAWRDSAAEERLARERPTGAARSCGPLAAALVEVAGNLVVHDEVVVPAVERGAVVIQASLGVKNVIKELLVAHRLNADAQELVLVDALITHFRTSPFLRPDVGLLVDGPPELALQWKLAEKGRLGLFEDYTAAGDRGTASFLELQSRSADIFRDLARSWSWPVHLVDGSGREANLRRGLDLLLSHPRIAPLLAAGRV